MDSRFLKRRGHSWSVRVPVPKHLQVKLGKAEVVVALHTRSQREAMRLRWPVVAEIQRSFAEGTRLPDLTDAREIARVIDEARARGDSASIDVGTGRAEELAGRIEAALGIDAARNWYSVAADGALPLSEAVDLWLAETVKYTKQSRQQHRAAARELTGFLGDIPINDVDRRSAGRFVTEHLLATVSPKTVNRKLSSLSSLWRWAIRRGHVENNPWTNQGVSKVDVVAQQEEKRPFTPEELRSLPLPGPRDHVLSDLMRMALFLGARINEIC